MILAALDNLKIAQKRDTQRYARTRDGSYRLQMTRIQEGDFVYRKRQTKTTINTSSGAVILRVKHVFDNGVLEVEGSDGKTMRDHVQNCSLCHLPNIDPTVRVVPEELVPATPCASCKVLDD
eukprot:jgi/Mesen1/6585/ME000338S05770